MSLNAAYAGLNKLTGYNVTDNQSINIHHFDRQHVKIAISSTTKYYNN